MNQQITNYKKYSYYLMISVYIIFSSCQKQNHTLRQEVNLLVKTEGIFDYNDTDNINKLSSSNSKTIEQNKKPKIINYGAFDAITEIEQSDINSSTNNKINKVEGFQNNKLSTSRLADTVKYRIVFFKKSTSEIVANEVVSANGGVTIYLNIDVPYKWIAYSINESTVPSFTNNTISKNDIANKDFLYCSGEITLQLGNNNLNLIFNRYMTQYVINIDSRGMFAGINSATKVKLSNNTTDLFRTANFNILQGKFIDNTYSTIYAQGASLKPITNKTDSMRAIFYTVDTIPTLKDELKVDFSPLSLTLDNNDVRTFATPSVPLTHPTLDTVNNAIISSTRGRRYTIKVKLIESGVKVGNTIWARSNLWYDRSNNKGKYRFRVSPHFRDTTSSTKYDGSPDVYTDPDDLWKWGASIPDGNTSDNVDQCSKVYPEGTWKLPNQSDFTTLKNRSPSGLYIIDRNDAKSKDYGLNLIPYKFFEYTLRYNAENISDDAYKTLFRPEHLYSTSSDLFFSGIGYRNSISILNSGITERPHYTVLASVKLPNNYNLLELAGGLSGGGFYWSSKEELLETASYFKFQYTNADLLKLDVYILNVQLLNINDVATNFLPSFSKNHRLNIRCVRNI